MPKVIRIKDYLKRKAEAEAENALPPISTYREVMKRRSDLRADLDVLLVTFFSMHFEMDDDIDLVRFKYQLIFEMMED